MELHSYISITISGKTEHGNLLPLDIDISETKELLSDVETLLFPSKPEKEERPKVSYEVKNGSVKNIFYIPVAKVIMFTALMAEIGKQGTVDILDARAAMVIDKWQRKAFTNGRSYAISSSISPEKPIVTIKKETHFIAPQSNWVNTTVYLYGKIYEEGGLNKVNLHIITDRYGKLPVKATEEQLTSGENKLFKVFGLWTRGKQNISTGELKDLELIDFITYQPEYDELVLQEKIRKASVNWNAIKDKDEWLVDVRGGAVE